MLFIPLMLLASSGKAQTTSKKKFFVFNALLFKNTPDLSQYGFKKINLIYEDGVISTNYHVKDIKDNERRFIDYDKINKQSLKSKVTKNIPTCLDVEHWNLYKKDNHSYAENKYTELIKSYRKIDKKSLVSVFHYGAISEKIYDASNVVYPCYYTHGENLNQWQAMVNNSIKSIKKNAKKNPIYAFIWPQYNPTPENPSLGYTFIDREMWRAELEALYKVCDGIVIWSHYRDEKGNEIYFDKNMPWFQETLEFMKSHNIR
jgi:hypothetical protein